MRPRCIRLGRSITGPAQLSVLRYAFSTPARQFHRRGLAGFLRIGATEVSTDSVLELENRNDVSMVIGLGLERIMKYGIGLRAEAISFDTDVRAALISFTYRFAGQTKKSQMEPYFKQNNKAQSPENVNHSEVLQHPGSNVRVPNEW